ncbi:MAG: hypothetical protein KatS3mg115_0813 [Candidatus Poribacteria bacterium]|nr:MAG: hypothetical protein KatS3mg115_0813 [Candidatus Poribacteria bacterium]
MSRRVWHWAIWAALAIGVPTIGWSAGRQGAVILELPHRSVRAAGMGEVFAAYEQEVSALLWNPAAIATLSRPEIHSAYNSFEKVFAEAGEGLFYWMLAWGMPLGSAGTLGASLQLNGKGSIEVTTDSPEVVAVEDLGTDWVLSLAYADRLGSHLRFGVAAKIIRLNLGVGFEQGSSATSYALDTGVQYAGRAGIPFSLGLSVLNVGTRIQFKDEYQSDPLPRKFRGSLIVRPWDSNELRLLVGAEVAAAIDKLSQDRNAPDFVQTIEERLDEAAELGEESPYYGKTRKELEDELIRQRGVGIYAFSWDRLERSVGAELWLYDLLAIRAGYKKYDDIAEPPGLELFDRITFGLSVNGAPFGVPLVFEYANGIWGPGGPTKSRVNSFALSFVL